MPTYEYRCEAGHEFEEEQRISDAPLERCPEPVGEWGPPQECGAPVKRLIPRGTGFVLQGSGWGKDGYGSK